MIAFTLMLFAAQMQSLPAPESIPVWEALPEDEEGHHFLDPASISRDGDIARVVYRSIYRVLNQGGARSMMWRSRFDCAAHTMGLEAVDAYDEDGRLFDSFEGEGDRVHIQPIDPPRTPPHLVRLAERVCGR